MKFANDSSVGRMINMYLAISYSGGSARSPFDLRTPQVERRDAGSTRAEDFFDAFRAGRATPGCGAGGAAVRDAGGDARGSRAPPRHFPTPITTLPIFCPLST